MRRFRCVERSKGEGAKSLAGGLKKMAAGHHG
jgi:hypothetical protein